MNTQNNQSGLTEKAKANLTKYLMNLIQISQSLETFKTSLAEIHSFDGIQLFKFIDKTDKHVLQPLDFTFIKSHSVKKVLHYAFSWFDIRKKGQITKGQFLQFLFPRTNQTLRSIITQRMFQETQLKQKQKSLQIQLTIFNNMFTQLMRKQKQNIPLRRQIIDQQNYSLKFIMKVLDIDKKGWLNSDNFHSFLNNHGSYVSKDRIALFLDLYDSDRNGKIQMKELQWLIEGLQKRNGTYRSILRANDNEVLNKRLNSCCTCKEVSNSSIKKASKSKIKEKLKTEQKQKLLNKQKLSLHEKSTKSKIKTKLQQSLFKNKQKNKKMKTQTSQKKSFNPKKAKQIQKTHQKHIKKVIKLNKQQIIHKQNTLQNDIMIKQDKLPNKKIIESFKNKKQYQQPLKTKKFFYDDSQISKQTVFIEQRPKPRNNYGKQREIVTYASQTIDSQQIDKNKSYVNSGEDQLVLLQRRRIQQIEKIHRQAQQRQKKLMADLALQKQRISHFSELQRKMLYEETQDRQYRLRNQGKFRLKTCSFDNKIERRLKSLYDDERRNKSINDYKLQRQSDYFIKYKNYCRHLAEINDPLGTSNRNTKYDQSAEKAQQIREEAKKIRAYSLGWYNDGFLRGIKRYPQNFRTIDGLNTKNNYFRESKIQTTGTKTLYEK